MVLTGCVGRQDMASFSCPPVFRENEGEVQMQFVKDEIWIGSTLLMFSVRVQTDDDLDKCAADPTHIYFTPLDLVMMECFKRAALPDLEEGHLVYGLPQPEAVVYVTSLDLLVGRVSMQPYGDTGTVTYNMLHLKGRGKPLGEWARVDRKDHPGTGSPLYHLNTWAMNWANDPDISKYTEDSDSDIENSAVPIVPTATNKRPPSAAAQRAAADSASDSEGSLHAGGHAPPADVSDADSDGSSEPAASLGSDADSANDDATSSSASDDTRADSDSDW